MCPCLTIAISQQTARPSLSLNSNVVSHAFDFWFHNHRGNEAWVVTSPSGNQPATLQRKGGDVWAGPDMSVPASISVMAPAAGHVWELGASYTVTFTATGSFDTVVVGVLASHGVASHAQANTRHCLVPAC